MATIETPYKEYWYTNKSLFFFLGNNFSFSNLRQPLSQPKKPIVLRITAVTLEHFESSLKTIRISYINTGAECCDSLVMKTMQVQTYIAFRLRFDFFPFNLYSFDICLLTSY